MRILHVTKKYLDIPGGDSIVVANLEKQQKELGHEVFILTSRCHEVRSSPTITEFGLKIESEDLDRINSKRIISLLILLLYSLIYVKKIRPDVIHSHSVDLGFVLSFACRFYRIPIVNTCHGVVFSDKQYSFVKRYTEKFFLKRARFNKIVTVDQNSVKSFEEKVIGKVVYIPNGVDLEEFDLEQFDKKQEKSQGEFIFLFVGRIEKDKGLTYLIRASNILKQKKQKFRIRIIGEGLDQDYFKRVVSGSKLASHINFLGKKSRKEIIDHYQKSDAFILPSLHEGFPLTLLEAWLARLPVIITNVGGISRVCKSGENALIIPPKNSERIAEAMLTLIDNPVLATKMGNNGRKLVEEKHNLKEIAEEVQKVYFDVLGMTSSSR